MLQSSRLARWRRWAARTTVRAIPLVMSGVVHALLVGLALAMGFRTAPRWRPVAQAELFVLEREVLATETTPVPRVEAQRLHARGDPSSAR